MHPLVSSLSMGRDVVTDRTRMIGTDEEAIHSTRLCYTAHPSHIFPITRVKFKAQKMCLEDM